MTRQRLKWHFSKDITWLYYVSNDLFSMIKLIASKLMLQAAPSSRPTVNGP